MSRLTTFCAVLSAICIANITSANASPYLVANLKTTDIAFSTVTGLMYAAVPNASAVNPNTLTLIDPLTAALGTSIPIGFDPARVVVSSDGTNLFTVIGGQRAVQRYNIPTASADQLFSISGGSQITEMYAVPGRPNAVAIHLAMPGFSPPAILTAVFENGVALPDQVGHGLGVGGPDIFSVDPTDGTKAYGYQNTVSSFDNVPMIIGPTGIKGGGITNLNGVLTGNVGHIAIVGDRLFDNLGHIFSISLGFQVGAFVGGGNFVLDPAQHKFFSLTQNGPNMQINAYSLDTLTLLRTDTLFNLSGGTSSLTRYGVNGLAFRTSNDKVVFVQSVAVPEPTTLALGALGCLGLLAMKRRRNDAIGSSCARR